MKNQEIPKFYLYIIYLYTYLYGFLHPISIPKRNVFWICHIEFLTALMPHLGIIDHFSNSGYQAESDRLESPPRRPWV